MRAYEINPWRHTAAGWVPDWKRADQHDSDSLRRALPYFESGVAECLGGVASPHEDVAEQIRIILFAREMGWL